MQDPPTLRMKNGSSVFLNWPANGCEMLESVRTLPLQRRRFRMPASTASGV